MEAAILVEDGAARAAFGAQLRHFRETRRWSLDDLGTFLGISGNYVYMMERGKLAASSLVAERFEALAKGTDVFAVSVYPDAPMRRIPIISWAQAGKATTFYELPESDEWQEGIDCACPDQRAFAVRLRGDSMEPDHHPGDVIIAMPNYPPQSSCLVLAKMAACEGVLFKKFTVRKSKPHHFRLSSLNPKYPARELTWDEVNWVYPVFRKVEHPGRGN